MMEGDWKQKMINKNYAVSVIIPVFNSSRTLELSLKSIFESDYPDFEVIVVDDGSTDNSVKIANKFPCKVIKKEANTGAADARNIGAKKAKYSILFFTDSDCIVKKDTISKIVSSFNENFEVVAGIYSKQPYNKSNIFSAYHSLFAYYNYCNSSVALFGTQCAAIKKNLFWKLGGFDSSVKGATVEDLKFQYKLQSIECKYHINKDAWVLHNSRDSLSSLLKSYYKRSKFATKLLLRMKKVMPTKHGYIVNYPTMLSYLTLFIIISSLFLILFNPFFIWVFLLGVVTFLFLKRKFYFIIKGKSKLTRIILLSFICDFFIIIGGIAGMWSYIRK